MKNVICTILLILVPLASTAQPASEIFLFDIKNRKNSVTIENPVNITNHKGYDNQPCFHPTETKVFYSSFNEEGRSDIRMYDFKSLTTTNITQTPEREYSPTVTPDRDHLSCIIQRDNNAQDLGKYPIGGGEAEVIIDNMTIGYHAWADNSHLVLFVLGTPNTLHYLRLPTKKDTIIAENVGRSLHRVPGEAAISFVDKAGTGWLIKKFDTHAMKVTQVAPTMVGSEDLCWLPDGKILMSNGTSLYFLRPKKDVTWQKVEMPALAAMKGITRLAVSPNGKKLAVVVEE